MTFIFIYFNIKKRRKRETLQLGQNSVKGKEITNSTKIGFWFDAYHDNIHFTMETD
jgi:hypothetical protein